MPASASWAARRSGPFVDRASSQADGAIVREHQHAVGAQPHVGLDARGPQPDRQIEGLRRVLGCVRLRPAMGEADGRVQTGGESERHLPIIADRAPRTLVFQGLSGHSYQIV